MRRALNGNSRLHAIAGGKVVCCHLALTAAAVIVVVTTGTHLEASAQSLAIWLHCKAPPTAPATKSLVPD